MARMSFATFLFFLTMAPFVAVNVAYYGGFVEGAEPVHDAQTGDGAPDGDGLTPARRAERDDRADLPGWFVASQGKRHTGSYPLERRVEFCPPDDVRDTCYATNPPTSGLHMPVQRNVQLESGDRVNLPPDPGVYDWVVPREAIPHVEEHGGVYVGHNCASDVCRQVVRRIASLVEEEVSIGGHVVMSPDPDLNPDTIALASWTRVDTFEAPEYTDTRVRNFIRAHSCRFDPEGLCPRRQIT